MFGSGGQQLQTTTIASTPTAGNRISSRKIILESKELCVFTRSGYRRLLRPLKGGSWLKCWSAVYDDGTLLLKALKHGESYEKEMILSKETTVSGSPMSGHMHCLVISNAKEAKKVSLDCGSVDRRHEWQTALIQVCATGPEIRARLLGRGSNAISTQRNSKKTISGRTNSKERAFRGILNHSLEAFLEWHESCYLYSNFKKANQARRRWWRAIDAVARQVLDKRKQVHGYSSLALIRLHRKIATVDKDTMSDIKRKARRIIRQVIREAHRKKKDKRALVTWADVVKLEALAHGLSGPTANTLPNGKSSLLQHQNSNLGLPSHLSARTAHRTSGASSGGTITTTSTIKIGESSMNTSLRTFRGKDATEFSVYPQDSIFRHRLQTLLRRERVLPTLTRTLELIRRKEQSDIVLADSMRGLWVARCVRALLNLPGGLAALLTMSQERGALRRLLVAALMCRVPMLTVLVLEMLSAFAKLPNPEGYLVVTNVLAQLDRSAQWGKPLCSNYLLRASPEALRWSPSCPRTPPPLSAIATLLADTTEHTCCPDLRCGVVTLFAALCSSQPDRSSAQWTQAKIFLACRAALGTAGQIVAIKKEKGDDTFFDLSAAAAGPRYGTRSSSVSSNADAKQRAKARRATLGRERGSTLMSSGSEYDHPDQVSTVSSGFIDPDQQAADRYGSGMSESPAAEALHPCPPLSHLCECYAQVPLDDHYGRLFGMQLEHFLDGWDHCELDEADEIDDLPVGSAERIALLAERIRRNALLLGRYVHLDDALNALGLDLEHAAFLPFRLLLNTTSKSDTVPDDFDADETGKARLLLDLGATTNAITKLRAVAASTGAPGKTGGNASAVVTVSASGAKASGSGLSPSPKKPNEMSGGTTNGEEKEEAEVFVALQDDPKYAKFFRMVRMHVPRMAVAVKMASEGLDPTILDLDPHGPAPSEKAPEDEAPNPSEEEQGRKSTEIKPAEEKAAIEDENKEELPLPLGCPRAPSRKLRRVFWEVIPDSKETWWDDVLGNSDEPPHFLSLEALDDLEAVFGPTRKEALSRADDSAKANAVRRAKLAGGLALATIAAGGATKAAVAASQRKRSLVTEAVGEKRAFALQLLYSSLRLNNEECINAIAALDPNDAVFVKNLPRLSTIYNMVIRSDELRAIETKAIETQVLQKKAGAISRTKTSKGDIVNSDKNDSDQKELDELSELMVSLVERARRPRAKVRALWLYATVSDQVSELMGRISAHQKCVDLILGADSLKRVLKVVLAVTTFLNHGTSHGKVRGIRIAALTKLRNTKTTPLSDRRQDANALLASDGVIKSLLQFVVKHCGVSATELKLQIPPALLKTVYNGPPREAIATQLDDLRAERDDAVAERGVLSREATTQAGGADARRVAVAAAAAARMAHMVADIDDELDGLKHAFNRMDDAVDMMLQHYGEPATTLDATDWLKDLDTFLAHYEVEYNDLREHAQRKERRELLAKKQRARESYLLNDNSDSGTLPPSNSRSNTTSPPVPGIVAFAETNASAHQPEEGLDDDDDDDAKPVKLFDKFVESAARGALVSEKQTGWGPGSINKSFTNGLNSPNPNASIHGTIGTHEDSLPLMECAECNYADSSTTPGAFSKSSHLWYCSDCWYEFASKNPYWKNDFGDETQVESAPDT